MRLLIVESEQADSFSPLAWTRPVFELMCGTRSVRQRVLDVLAPSEWGVIIRPHLADAYRAQFPEAHVNDPAWIDAADTLVIDGLWAGSPFILADHIKPDIPICCNNEPIAMLRTGRRGISNDLSELRQLLTSQNCLDPDLKLDNNSQAGQLLKYPWDLISCNGAMIKLDFELMQLSEHKPARIEQYPPGITPSSNLQWIAIHPSATIEPFVCINAESGPVIIEENVQIQAFTRLEGPCFVGRDTQLFRANIRGETSIGPVCRVGGEVEASIFHGFANKYHDGFLGHSYISPWCNLGALTTNSDLKNDYSPVSMPVGTDYIPTQEKKVGCFLGDHTKTAIGTLFNTGSSVGVMSMVLPGGKLCPKHIPSFCRLWQGQLDDRVDFEQACETAALAMSRRGQVLTDVDQNLLADVLKLTAQERSAALNRG